MNLEILRFIIGTIVLIIGLLTFALSLIHISEPTRH